MENAFLNLLKAENKEKLKIILIFLCPGQKPFCPFGGLKTVENILISNFFLASVRFKVKGSYSIFKFLSKKIHF